MEETCAGDPAHIEADFGVISQLSGLAEQEREFLADAMTGF
jgi:hypothetical protein